MKRKLEDREKPFNALSLVERQAYLYGRCHAWRNDALDRARHALRHGKTDVAQVYVASARRWNHRSIRALHELRAARLIESFNSD